VEIGHVDAHTGEVQVIVRGNVPLPPEIVKAATTWANNHYADMDLTEYLNRMFDPRDYSKEAL
jgi:hypothetical protein